MQIEKRASEIVRIKFTSIMTAFSAVSNAFQAHGIRNIKHRPYHAQSSCEARRLFLARFLDALLSSVHGALALGLASHLFAGLLVYNKVSIARLPVCGEYRDEVLTSLLLCLESKLILIELLGRLLLLLVVDRVGAG